MPTVVKRSLAGGELAPALHARADTAKYQTGLATCRNAFVMKGGGVASRPGSLFVGPAKYNDRPVRLIPFIFNSTQAYAVEFGHQYARFIYRGGYILGTAKAASTITRADPCVVTTSTSHGFTSGDLLYVSLSGSVYPVTVAMSQMWNRFIIPNVTGATTFEAQHPYGDDVDSTTFTAYGGSGLNVTPVIEITTPYDSDDLFDITYTQSGDVMTLCHSDYPAQELIRSSATSWAISAKVFGSGAPLATGFSQTYNDTSNPRADRGITYSITGVSSDGEESLPAEYDIEDKQDKGVVSTGAANASGIYTILYGGPLFGRELYVRYSSGAWSDIVVQGTDISGKSVTVEFVHSGTGLQAGEIIRADGTLFRSVSYVYNRAGTTAPSISVGAQGDCQWYPFEHTIAWTTKPDRFRVYRGLMGGAVVGYVGDVSPDASSPVTYVDEGATPDYTRTPPKDLEFFGDVATTPGGEADYAPGAVCYFQQRMVLAGSNTYPETAWLSRVGYPNNFLVSYVSSVDDAIEVTPSSYHVARIRHLTDMSRLLFWSEEGVLLVDGGANGIILPGEINVRRISYEGIGSVPPIIIGSSALYVTSRGRKIRDLSYSFDSDGYAGNDLTVFASHLFATNSVTDWAYQSVPDSVVWAVRDDGRLVSMTYLREHDIWGWSRHDTYGRSDEYYYKSGSSLTETSVGYGRFLTVASVPESGVDAIYTAARRKEGPEASQVYIERLADRYQDQIGEYVCADCSIVFNGKNTRDDWPVAIIGGPPWTAGSTVAVYLPSGASLSMYDIPLAIGDKIRVTHEGLTVYLTVTSYATNYAGCTLDEDLPAALQTMSLTSTGGSTADWGVMKSTLTGLAHLEGQAVSVKGDGFIVGSPLDSNVTTRTVADGLLSLGDHYEQIHGGLPFITDIETLDLDYAESNLIGKQKHVSEVTVMLNQTARLYVGPEAPSDDDVDPLEDLSLVDVDGEDGSGGPSDGELRLRDINYRQGIPGHWNSNGRLFMRNIDPVPVTVLGVSPRVVVGERG